jgi:hypothetical protein
LRAHFDGKVFVPDEPVNLPAGKAVEVTVHESSFERDPLTGPPLFAVKPGSKTVTPEDVRRALQDAEVE